MSKTYLYHRPAHGHVRIMQKDPATDTVVEAGIQTVSALSGIIEAVKATSLGQGMLVDGIRVIKKLEAAHKYQQADLVDEYIVFTEQEKNVICNAMNTFNWSKFAEETGNTLWTNWIALLAGFSAEFEEEYKAAWLEYDPLNPPAAFAEWKRSHAESVEKYEAAVKAAEEKAIKEAAKAAENLDAASDSKVIEGEFAPVTNDAAA